MLNNFFDLIEMHQVIDEEEQNEHWIDGERFDFDFVKNFSDKMVQNSEDKIKTNGAVCVRCREHCPYAEPEDHANFKCWSCRH